MLIFIDDSGDPGFKLDKGSTSHFVIAMVIFDDELEAEKTAVAIKELKRQLRLSEQSEFRFFKTSNSYRIAFLTKVIKFNFRVRCLVVNKSLIYSRELQCNKNSFYAYFIKEVLKNNDDTIIDAKIRLDGGGSRDFRNTFVSYLRRELNSHQKRIMKNFKMVDSKRDVLIQMADMIAGSINRAQNTDKKDCCVYRNIISSKIDDEWFFK